MLRKSPERFLHSDFYQDVPVSALVEWLDFVYGEAKGYGWIDELRRKTTPYYSGDNYNGITEGATKMTSSLRGLVRGVALNIETKAIDKQKELVIPSLRKLVARNNVLEGFIAQYEMLERGNLRPSDFENQIALLDPSSANDGFIILKPS